MPSLVKSGTTSGRERAITYASPPLPPLPPMRGRRYDAVNRQADRGKLVAAEGGKVRIEVDGAEFDIPVDDVEKANLEPEF